jgi:hypothetical protein
MKIELLVAPEKLESLVARIESLNVKARKLKVPEIDYVIVPHDKKFKVKLSKTVVAIEGWKVTHLIINNPRRVFNFQEIKLEETKYHDARMTCEHCNSNRYRVRNYVLENADGMVKQVGSGCVKDFGGKQLDTYINFCRDIEVLSSEEWDKELAPNLYAGIPVKYYLAACIESINSVGYSSSESLNPTKTNAKDLYRSGKISETSEKLAEQVLEYFKNGEFRNDFQKNIKNCLDHHVTNFGTEGLIAYAYVSYLELTKVEPTLNYVGEVGAKQELELTYVRTVAMYGAYGENYLVIFRDENNNEIVWTTANGISHLTNNAVSSSDSGKKVKLFTTIKAHKMYQGKKQTYITRPKFIA